MASDWQLVPMCVSPYARELSLSVPACNVSVRVLAGAGGTAELLSAPHELPREERSWADLLTALAGAGVQRLLLAADRADEPRSPGAGQACGPNRGQAGGATGRDSRELPGTLVGRYLCFEGGLPATRGWPRLQSCLAIEEIDPPAFDEVFLETAKESRDPYYARFADFCLQATRHWHYTRPSCIRVIGYEHGGELVGISSYWVRAGGWALMLHGGVVRRHRGRGLSLAIGGHLVQSMLADGITRTRSRIAQDSPIMLGHMARIGQTRVGTAQVRVVEGGPLQAG